jgi:hypothetical protein
MTIKSYATLVLAIGVCLVTGAVTYAYGGIRHLFSADVLLVVFAINLPFFTLWAAAKGSKGTAVPRSAITISIAFILLDAAVYFGTGSKLSDSNDSIVFGVVASVEIILSLLMVVGAIVSCVHWESDESNNTG